MLRYAFMLHRMFIDTKHVVHFRALRRPFKPALPCDGHIFYFLVQWCIS